MKSWPKTDTGTFFFIAALVLFAALGPKLASAQDRLSAKPPPMREGLTIVAPTQYADEAGTTIESGELAEVTLWCGLSATNMPQQMPLLNPEPGQTLSVTKEQLLTYFAFRFNTTIYCNASATATNGLTSERTATVNFTVPDERNPAPPLISVQ